MFMKKSKIYSCLYALAVCAGLTAVLSGCSREDLDSSAGKDSTVFSVSPEFPTQKGATMTITHNGPDDCRYTGCVYSGSTTMQQAMDARIAQMKESAEDFRDLTFSGREYSTVVTGLQANREYSYVVFGVNEDFTVYGTPGSCTFTTQTGAGLFTVYDVTQGSEEESAIIQVMPRSGYEDRTYFVFWTADVTTPAEDLIKMKIESMAGEDFASVVRSGDQDFNIPGEIPSLKEGETLSKGGKYRAIAVGMYPDGVTYGIPSETVFKTNRGDLPYYSHQAWTVTYDGKGIYNNSVMGVMACENIRVTSTDTERFFISAVEGSRLSSFLDGSSTEEQKQAQLRTVIEEETELLRVQIEDDPYNTGASWADYTYTGTVQEPFPNIEDDSWWFGLAIGVDVDGIVTGEYSISAPFQAEVPTVTEEYSKWVGSWTVTGTYQDENGASVDITFDIEIDDIVPGVGYTVSGFGEVPGIMDEAITVPLVTVLYDSETGRLQWIGSFLGPVTIDEASQLSAYLYFAAVNGYDVITGDNFVMAETSLEEDGHAVFSACPFELSDGTTFTPESMGYVADVPYAGYLLVSVNPDIESLTMVRKADVPETGGGTVQEASAPGMGGGRLPAGMSLSEVKLANHSIL